ncbi:MAG: phasin family protein [Thermodesulfobacteriota bacterium]
MVEYGKRVKKRRGLIDLYGSKKLISVVEEKIEKRLRLVMGAFEKKFKDALMRLDIRYKAEVNTLLSKVESLEVRIDKLEGE